MCKVDETIIESFNHLEKLIKKNKIYKRCKSYDSNCEVCDFWKRFDLLRKDILDKL